MNDEVSSICSQIVEQIEVIPEIVLSKVSKLIDSLMRKIQGLHRMENRFTINKHPEMSYQFLDRVMKIHQFHKKFFHISKCKVCNAEKTLEFR